jgi:hypothetical protein
MIKKILEFKKVEGTIKILNVEPSPISLELDFTSKSGLIFLEKVDKYNPDTTFIKDTTTVMEMHPAKYVTGDDLEIEGLLISRDVHGSDVQDEIFSESVANRARRDDQAILSEEEDVLRKKVADMERLVNTKSPDMAVNPDLKSDTDLIKEKLKGLKKEIKATQKEQTSASEDVVTREDNDLSSGLDSFKNQEQTKDKQLDTGEGEK